MLALPLKIEPNSTQEGRIEFEVSPGISAEHLDLLGVTATIKEARSHRSKKVRESEVYDARKHKVYRGEIGAPYPVWGPRFRRWRKWLAGRPILDASVISKMVERAQRRMAEIEREESEMALSQGLSGPAVVANEILNELGERTRYARAAKLEGGERLDTWRKKVRDESQGLYADDIKALPIENLSKWQISALAGAKRRVADFNTSTVRLAKDDDRDSNYVANLYLQRAEKTEQALAALRDACEAEK